MNVGILLNNVFSNQEAFLTIAQGNELQASHPKINVELYYKDIAPFFLRYAGLVTSLDKAMHSNSYLVATNMELAVYAINAYSDKPRFLYLSEIEWLNGKNEYLQNYTVLTHPQLHIIVPSYEYADELKNYCGKDAIAVIPNFNLIEIIRVIDAVRNPT
jgi:hypothetical protein